MCCVGSWEGALARDNPLSDRSVAGSQLTNDLQSPLYSAPQAQSPETTQAGLGQRILKPNKFIGRWREGVVTTTFLLVDTGREKVRIIIESIICDRAITEMQVQILTS